MTQEIGGMLYWDFPCWDLHWLMPLPEALGVVPSEKAQGSMGTGEFLEPYTSMLGPVLSPPLTQRQESVRVLV